MPCQSDDPDNCPCEGHAHLPMPLSSAPIPIFEIRLEDN
jgi:hypothetical protein